MSDQQPRNRNGWKSEAVVVLAMLGLVLLVLLPVLAQWVPSIYDDCPIETLPGLIQAARAMQSGGLALWDFATFSGGKPTYTHNMYLGFYPPMYPVFRLVDPDDAEQCFWWLMLFPYTVHLLWAALGAYAFARVVLQVPPLAASLVGILYALSPEMGFQVVTAPVAITLSFIPWCALAIAQLMETGRPRWWICGTLLLALMGSSGNPNYLIRSYFFLSAMLAGLWLVSVGQRYRSSEPSWMWGRFCSGVLMFAVSIGLAGVSWAGTLESVAWINHAIPLSASEAARFPESNMHPLSVVTLLIPGFFGNLDPEPRWGIGPLHNETMTLPGGICFLLAIVVALSVLSPRRAGDRDELVLRRWALLCGATAVAGLLIMMGQYTPLFGLACTILPWFFEFPHPVYYRMTVCFSTAVLVGIGISVLLSDADRVPSRTVLTRSARVMAWIGMVGLVAAMFWDPDRGISLNPFGSALVRFGQWSWFVTRPLLYFAIALVFLYWLLRDPERRSSTTGKWLAGAILAETLMIAVAMFYWGFWQREIADYAHPTTDSSPSRYVAEDHLYQLVPELSQQMAQRPGRCVGDKSVFDNVVWYFDGRAMMGYSAKPLLPWYETMLQRVTFGDNNLRFRKIPLRLLANMNVRYLLSMHTGQHPFVSTTESGPFYIHELAEPVPYAYLQDRVLALPHEQQLEKLMDTDLRQAVFVDPQDAKSLPAAALRDAPKSSEFEDLPESSAVQEVDQQTANRMMIRVKNSKSAMLVVAECFHPDWKVLVNGQPRELLRVNYVQQGVWLEGAESTKEIEFRFEPSSVKWGKIASLTCAGLVALVILLGRKAAGKKGEEGNEASR